MEIRSMDIIKTEHLVYEYEKRDEEGNVIGVSRAIDGVDVDVTPDSSWRFSATTDPGNLHLPNI